MHGANPCPHNKEEPVNAGWGASVNSGGSPIPKDKGAHPLGAYPFNSAITARNGITVNYRL